MKKQVCVIGLGRFGSTLAQELFQSGHDVLAIDVDEAKVQNQLDRSTYAVRADATNESILKELDVADQQQDERADDHESQAADHHQHKYDYLAECGPIDTSVHHRVTGYCHC